MNAIPDDRLSLIFACCHPALGIEARIALTLRTLAGLTTEEIADAFLVPHATMAQRLVRVKRKIREAAIPFDVPPAERLGERLDDVCTVLYLIFNEGYSASAGDRPRAARAVRRSDSPGPRARRADAARARGDGFARADAVPRLAPRSARSRATARCVTLAEQDRTRWNRAKIAEANELARARDARTARRDRTSSKPRSRTRTRRRRRRDEVDWNGIAELYGHLERMTPSPVVSLNRAVAIGFADGPAAGLDALDALPNDALAEYHLYHVARADALERLGRADEARAAYRAALERTQNAAEQTYLRGKIAPTPA